MLEPILQSLRDVDGVQGAMIVDPTAAVVAHRAHTIYDLSVLQQVARAVVSSVDSVQLIQDDWDVLTAHFGEGKLLLRSLRVTGSRPRRYVLAVIADATLNAAFLGVALRVAATKLLSELEAGPPPPSSGAIQSALASGSTGRVPLSEAPRPELAKTGLSWSGTGSGSGVGSSDVGVTDPASSTFLSACTKALAASIGPMAKVFVKEAVRKVCGERPFSRTDGAALIAHLAAGIEDSDDRAVFQRATRAL
jgi:predicted regulator of Ras-like GTPase activity (Roadblock/LC7/MglB family)